MLGGLLEAGEGAGVVGVGGVGRVGGVGTVAARARAREHCLS